MAKPLLILDIDETLLHSTQTAFSHKSDMQFLQYHVYFRPHTTLFLKTALEHYQLACWSSATSKYLQLILPELMEDLYDQLIFVWDRSRCTSCFDPTLQEKYFLKDLKKVKRRGYDLKQVLILEDEPRKVHRNYGNAIYVQPFMGAINDDELLKLAQYLTRISKVSNYRLLEKRFWRSQI